MDVLVAYASDHGSTKGVAERIAGRLRSGGIEVDVRPTEGVDALDGYAAVVIGSAIHNQSWLPRATTFVRTHQADLVGRPTWLFSVSSVGDTNSFFGPRVTRRMQRMRQEPRGVTELRNDIGALRHRNFAGAVAPEHWNVAGRLFMRAFGGTYGDHRDWEDIDRWADAIVLQLRERDAPSSRTDAGSEAERIGQ